MSSSRIELAKFDICTLFIHRYILEKKPLLTAPANATRQQIDLVQDVQDLQYFPERLEGSYKSEWLSDIVRLSQGTSLSDDKLKRALGLLSTKEKEELSISLDLIQQAETITQSPKVKVIKTPLKSYIETLIKI